MCLKIIFWTISAGFQDDKLNVRWRVIEENKTQQEILPKEGRMPKRVTKLSEYSHTYEYSPTVSKLSQLLLHFIVALSGEWADLSGHFSFIRSMLLMAE